MVVTVLGLFLREIDTDDGFEPKAFSHGDVEGTASKVDKSLCCGVGEASLGVCVCQLQFFGTERDEWKFRPNVGGHDKTGH